MKDKAQDGNETKGALLYTTLRNTALAKGPNERLPSVRTLCEELSVSRTTLDQVLNNLEAHDIIYRKHGSGLFVSPKLFRKTVGIIIDSSLLSNHVGLSPIWGLLWGLFAQEAERRSHIKNEYYCLHTILPASEIPLSEEIIHLVQTRRIHGVLNIGVPHKAVKWLTDQGVPCISCFVYGPWQVRFDFIEMVRLAVSRLVQRGCRRIGLWAIDPSTTPSATSEAFSDEVRAFRYFLADHGLEYHPELVRSLLPPQDHNGTLRMLTNQQQGYHIAQEVFSNSNIFKPDGIVIINDMVTDGALAALLTQKVNIGEDVHIVTHANAGMMTFFEYINGISVIEFDPQILVHKMFELLDLLLAGQSIPEQCISIAPRWRQASA